MYVFMNHMYVCIKYINVYLHVCMYVYMYVCMHVYQHAALLECVVISLRAMRSMPGGIIVRVCMHECIHVCMCGHLFEACIGHVRDNRHRDRQIYAADMCQTLLSVLYVCVYIPCICMCVCMYVCMCIYI